MRKISTSLCFMLFLAWSLAISTFSNARIFHDSQGQKIEAELVAVQGDEVTLQKRTRKFTLPIARFSEEDQKFIREWALENRAVAGETLTFEFPDLVKDFHGGTAAFKARIPEGYDRKKPVGLIIFLDGANGHNGPEGAMGLSKNDFICVGLPYPDNGRNPNQSNMVGSFDEVWAYWKPMLAELEKAVPNLDPELRIIGGFSNGAHAIDGLMANREFVASFSAFYLIDGGGALGGAYRNAEGKHIYISYGENSPNRNNSQRVIQRAERAGMKVVSHMMKETGHAFSGSEREKVKSWIDETVVADLQADE